MWDANDEASNWCISVFLNFNSNNMRVCDQILYAFTPGFIIKFWIPISRLELHMNWSHGAHQCDWCGWRVHSMFDKCTVICIYVDMYVHTYARICTCVYTHTLACPPVGSYLNEYIFEYSSFQHAYTHVFKNSQLGYKNVETDSQKYETLLWAWNRGRKNKPKFMLYHIMICQSVGSYPNKYIFKYSSSQRAYAHVLKIHSWLMKA